MRKQKTQDKAAAGPLIGAHMSISGGVDQAPLRGQSVGCRCIQIFTKSNMQWAARPLAEKEIEAFKRNCAETGIAPVVAHNCYLINVGTADRELYKKSFDSFHMELERCQQLDVPALIVHPGSHTGSGEAAGSMRGLTGSRGFLAGLESEDDFDLDRPRALGSASVSDASMTSPTHGMSRLISCSMARAALVSLGLTRVKEKPSRPARPVRPMRCT